MKKRKKIRCSRIIECILQFGQTSKKNIKKICLREKNKQVLFGIRLAVSNSTRGGDSNSLTLISKKRKKKKPNDQLVVIGVIGEYVAHSKIVYD